MRLDVERAQKALTELAHKMNSVEPEQAAWGVIQIANAAMERAVRAISVERGYDPREFTLVPFGGSGPLHACSLASALRISRILIPRAPGVLSALGMTIADLIKDVSQSLLGEQVSDLSVKDTIFSSLEARALAEMIEEGIPVENVEIERSLDMRYKGQSYEITVGEPLDGDWQTAFHTAHQRLYGHHHVQSSIEYVNARVKATGKSAKPDLAPLQSGGSEPADASLGTGEVWFSPEGPISTPFYQRDRLLAGNEIAGPAVIFQLDTTIVIDQGWFARVDELGNLVLSL
jgi:N-methylhydantoinase A